jgi:hypothetical protein
MSKVAFLASFLAAFITMDAQLFHGDTTRMVWDEIIDVSHAAQSRIVQWTQSH